MPRYAMWAGFIEPWHLVDGVGIICVFSYDAYEAWLQSPWGESPLKRYKGMTPSFLGQLRVPLGWKSPKDTKARLRVHFGWKSHKVKQGGYRPWVRDPKALEEDPRMGWLLEAIIGLEGESPRWIVWHIWLHLVWCGIEISNLVASWRSYDMFCGMVVPKL